jgi:hypothetical protein
MDINASTHRANAVFANPSDSGPDPDLTSKKGPGPDPSLKNERFYDKIVNNRFL